MQVKGSFTIIDGIEYYKISNSEKLSPFFIQVASSTDIWIFLSSNGGLTAGRKNSSGNIFPYETDDKLHIDYETGSKTIVKIKDKIWQPFEINGALKYNVSRNIYKSCFANSVILEEVNHDLNIKYSYKYQPSEKYGLVKTSKFSNLLDETIKIEVLDGLMNIMPYGVNADLQANSSTLVDAYKAAELEGDNLAIYSLTTTINDTPSAVEMLKANVTYNTLENRKVFLNTDVISKFINNENLENLSPESYGKKCGYFLVSSFDLEKEKEYSFILDNGYDHSKIEEILDYVKSEDFSDIYLDIKKGTDDLVKIVKDADGIQNTGDKIACATHYLSTLYNVMRGGTFENGYEFKYDLFIKFVEKRNKEALNQTDLLLKIKECKTINQLKEIASENDVMYRLALEFMPLSFSRRHGDPSRPWNKFNIAIKDENGNKTVSYEGNWRDIFQNWEALGLSFPAYYENMVAKFVNASTINGYNPYRINNDGIDWEKPEEDNPFSGLGYWGDHQIIYLLRLLKGLSNHYPKNLEKFMQEEIFSYANVPYIVKDYSEILKDSKNTLVFDFKRDREIEDLISNYGTDAKLVIQDNKVYTVSLAEKLLVPALSKISNLLPGGGIWMNTQRPEWNDANNAIVGIGLSMVTVYHLKAYLEYIKNLFKDSEYNLSIEVVNWLKEITKILSSNENFKGNEKSVLDKMGYAFSAYQSKVYNNGFSGKEIVSKFEIEALLNEAIKLVDYTISENKGDVYSSYNLLSQDFSVSKMKPMLEGQSAIISAELLSAKEVVDLISSIENDLYSKKDKYHTLYPIKKTTRFINKNIASSGLIEIEGITTKDKNSKIRFDSKIINEETLINKCKEQNLSKEITDKLVNEYEAVFAHKKFNGRSDVMYKFEGIGCVYWHQNAKFALGILETAQNAILKGEDITEIYKAYNKLLEGFIYRKTPEECSAIPIEPYSHTSFNNKSEQPGMTGQVKESVIMRRGEMGVRVLDGKISFEEKFLRPDEFLENNEINFTCYGVKCVYKKSTKKGIVINGTDKFNSYTINEAVSEKIFNRTNEIELIEIYI